MMVFCLYTICLYLFLWSFVLIYICIADVWGRSTGKSSDLFVRAYTGGLVGYSGIGSQKLLVGLFPVPFGPWVVLGNHLT